MLAHGRLVLWHRSGPCHISSVLIFTQQKRSSCLLLFRNALLAFLYYAQALTVTEPSSLMVIKPDATAR